MQIRLLFGIILLLSSCKQPPVLLPPDEAAPAIMDIDTDPPKIKWIYPRFDAVVNGIVTVECQIKDTSEIYTVELFVDSLQSGINSNSTPDTTFTFYWHTTNYDNGSEPILFVKAADNEGNDTVSTSIRVIIDNTHSYPNPVDLYSINPVLTDSVISGFTVKWRSSNDQYFAKYILERSADDPLMINSSEIFSTGDKAVTQYEDEIISSASLSYYRIKVEDQFGKQTPGNVLSSSGSDMPKSWNILLVQYTANSLSISWNNPHFDNYEFHRLLYSDTREGNYEILESYTDPTKSQYQSYTYNTTYAENWFKVATGDSLGQISMSPPYMHPNPQDPLIDSVLYNNNTFNLHWTLEPDGDFISYGILSSLDENPYHLFEEHSISTRTDTTFLITGITEGEYYLYQIITTDAWGLETRGPVIIASSFYKFSTIADNGTNDVLYSVITADEGRYFAVGESYNSGSWLLQVGGLGEIEGTENYGESNTRFRHIAHASDGGYLITGSTINNQMEDLLVEKINDNGSTEWSNNYGSEFNDGGNAIVSLTDGGIGVIGYSHTNTDDQDIYILKIDVDGNEIWSQTIGDYKSDEGHDILPLDNGGMVLLGETHSQGNDDGDIWILELDSDGNIVDTILIGGEGLQIGYSFVKSNLGGFTIAGKASGRSGVTDALMIRINDSREVEWTFSYGGIYNDMGYSIIYSDGGWILAGQTYSYDVGNGDAWLVKVSEMGELEWMQTYGGINNDTALDINLASDGGFIICGSTYVPGNQSDGWLIKTDSRGNYKGILSYP